MSMAASLAEAGGGFLVLTPVQYARFMAAMPEYAAHYVMSRPVPSWPTDYSGDWQTHGPAH